MAVNFIKLLHCKNNVELTLMDSFNPFSLLKNKYLEEKGWGIRDNLITFFFAFLLAVCNVPLLIWLHRNSID